MRIDLTVVGPDGTARDVAVLARRGTIWRDLRSRFGAAQWWCGDRQLTDADILGDEWLRDGAVLHAGTPGDCLPPVALAPAVPSGHRLDVVGGPDAGRSVPLGRTPVTVGRAPECSLVLHDPRVSRPHAQLTLDVRGATVQDCGSAGGTFVDGVPAGDVPVPVPVGAYVRMGDTYLAVSRSDRDAPAVAPGDDVAEIVLPPPPDRSAAARVQWVAAALPAVLGVGLALAMHSVQFLLFALLSPVAMLGSAVADRMHHGRERRRSGRQFRRRLAEVHTCIERQLVREVAARRAADPGPPSVLRSVRDARRGGAATDPLRVRLGLADLPSRLRVRAADGSRPAGIAHAVPFVLDLARGPLGINAPPAVGRGVARWVIGQLAARAMPDSVGLLALLSPDAEAEWRWLRWLPHLDAAPAVAAEQQAEVVAELVALRESRLRSARAERWSGRRIVLLVDGRLIDDVPGLADVFADLLVDGDRLGIGAVWVGSSGAPAPACFATTVVAVGETGSTVKARTPDGMVQFIADRVDVTWCDQLARRLAALSSGRGGASALPAACSLLEMLGLTEPTAARLSERWRDGGDGVGTVLGVAPDGPVRLDLVRDGPHALVAGTTGSGKSELLRTLVAGLAANHPPDAVGFVLVDYKGGAAFAECAVLPHTLGVVSDLDGHLAARAVASLECELRRRERLFADAGARDFSAYRAVVRGETLARLVIVVDEFAELAAELPEFVSGLVGIARRGRSLGVHLVLATQRPAGVVSAEIRANMAVRIALRVTDAGDSQDVIDCPDAAAIDRHRPGRGYLRLPGCTPILLQTALVSGTAPTGGDGQVQLLELDAWRRPIRSPATSPATTELQQLAEAVSEAALRDGRDRPARPWLPPLPQAVAVESLRVEGPTQVALGLLDLPREQRQVPFRVDASTGGSMLFAGGPGSGRTSALRTLAVAAAARLAPSRLHVHVIDHSGGGLADLAALPHCGSLAIDDLAVTARLLARLGDEVSRRRSAGAADDDPALLLLLDGWEQFLAAAEQHADTGVVEALLALLRAGPSVGLTIAVAGDRGTLAARVCSAIADKLALRLTARADYALLGLPERSVPARMPPGRAVRAADGAELQLAHLGSGPTRAAAQHAIAEVAARWKGTSPAPEPIRVRALPVSVRLSELTRRAGPGRPPPPDLVGRPGRNAPVLLGVGGDAAEPLAVHLFAGRARLLVAGPPGSGRSTLLLTLFDQLLARDTQVLVAAPQNSPLATRAHVAGHRLITPEGDASALPAGPAVLLLDDAEAFLDAPAGEALTAWAQRRADAAVVAAGRSDDLALTFRGIAAHVRKARCAVLLDPGPGDGELAGVRLTRPRAGGPPGRGVVIGDRAWGPPFGAAPVPIQVALP